MAWRAEELPPLDRYGTREKKLADQRLAVSALLQLKLISNALLCGKVCVHRAIPASSRDNPQYR